MTEPHSCFLQTFKILTGGCEALPCSWSQDKTRQVCKVPRLLGLPLTIWDRFPLSSVSPCPPCTDTSFRIYLGNPWGCEPIISEAAKRPKKWVLGKRHLWTKFWVGHQPVCGEGCPKCQVLVDCLLSMGMPPNPWLVYCTCLKASAEYTGTRKRSTGSHSGLAWLWAN